MTKRPLMATLIYVASAALLLAGCSSPSATSANAGNTANAGNASAAPSASAAPAANWYDTTYGTFAPVTTSGSGATLIPIPAGAKAGIITAKYSGSDNFMIAVLNKANQPTVDSPVNAIGNYSGVTGFGFNALGSAGTQLQVTATGAWSITIAPVASAPTKPASGIGDSVFLYNGGATSWTFTSSGTGNFIVNQYSANPMPGVSINEIGAYSGKVPVFAGPSVVVLESDGNWTVG